MQKLTIQLKSQSADPVITLAIPAAHKKILSLKPSQIESILDDVDDDNSFINSQEVLTLDFIKVQGNKVLVYPNESLLENEDDLKGIKLKRYSDEMQKALNKWLKSNGW